MSSFIEARELYPSPVYIVLHTAQAAEDTQMKYIILETTANSGEPRVGALNGGVLPMAHLSQPHVFTPSEESRLSTYKAAVAARLYTDALDEPAYRFTSEELTRLVVYKAGVVASFYTDQIEDEDREG